MEICIVVVQRENLADLLCVMCVFLFQQNGSLAEKKNMPGMRTLLLVPCAQGGVMHSLGRSLRRAEEPNIIFEDGPWGVLQTSSAYSVCKFRGKIVLLDISFQRKCALYATKKY